MFSTLTSRLIDRSRTLDYVWAFVIGALPIGVAMLIGAGGDVTVDKVTYHGYYERWNWSSFAIIAPLVLFAFRWAVFRVAPVASPTLGRDVPRLVALVGSEAGRPAAYAAFREAILAPRTLIVALVAALVIDVLDVWDVLIAYQRAFTLGAHAVKLETLPRALRDAPDWTIMFVAKPDTLSHWANLVLVIVAYAAEGFLIFMGLLFVSIAWRHNVFFLKRIYQRRLAQGDPNSYIVVDLDDGDRCFGFRTANEAFNTQVLCLTLAAIFLLITRFTHYSRAAATTADLWLNVKTLSWGTLFPLPGQWSIPLAWLVAMVIIGLPAAVKLLPLLPLGGKPTPVASVVTYMREFLPGDRWPYAENPTREEVDYLASRFATNAFWPTGDNRANQLFFFAFFGFLIVTFPIAKPGVNLAFSIYLASAAILASLLTFAMLGAFGLALKGVDERLMKPPAHELEPPTQAAARQGRTALRRSVFISYRRTDSQAWAGRLEQTLEARVVRPATVFRDVSDIGAGADWANVLEREIDNAHVVLVMIGRSWTADDGGRSRLHEPNDMVRREVLAALTRNKHVIPVLVSGAAMPDTMVLPDDIAGLCARNAFELSDSRWDFDVERLVEAIAAIRGV